MRKFKAKRIRIILASFIALALFGFAGIFTDALTEDDGGLPHYCATLVPVIEEVADVYMPVAIGCHTLMKPEYKALKKGVHAKAHCTDCHVGGSGPKGLWYWIKAKYGGATGQLPEVLQGTYDTPIKVPIHNLNPVEETCGLKCHKIEKVRGKKMKKVLRFREDKNNTAMLNLFELDLGNAVEGQESGIHKHFSKDFIVEYMSEDNKRKNIQWVKLKYRKNANDSWKTKIWARPGFRPNEHADEDDEHGQEVKKMDCYDCHNRVGHDMLTLDDALDGALQKGFEELESGREPAGLRGALDPRIPYIKKIAKMVLEEESNSFSYSGRKAVADRAAVPTGPGIAQVPTFKKKIMTPTAQESVLIIEMRIKEFYRDNYPSINKERLELAIDAIVELFLDNVDSNMLIRWGTYPSHIGHEAIPGKEDYSKTKTEKGCYRCHNEELKPVSGADKPIFSKCERCHRIDNQFTPIPKP